MSVEIQLLGVGDEAVLADVAPDVFDHPVQPGLAAEFLADPRHHLAVARDAGRIVGFASALHYVHPDKPPELWVNEVGVASTHQRRCPFVVVVGHPKYYPRFGFERASLHGLASQWDGMPDEAFMVAILDQPAMAGVRGVARYRDEFDEVG